MRKSVNIRIGNIDLPALADSREEDEQFITDFASLTDVATKVDSSWSTSDLSSPPTGVTVDTIGGELRITRLDLFNRDIEGTLPDSFGNSSKCKFINIKYNSLTGEIPSTIGNLTSCVTFLLAGSAGLNNENGVPPADLSTTLYPLKADWGGNYFSGSIPPEIGNMSNVEFIDISRNFFTDTNLPPEIGNLTKLKVLILNNNGFIGGLPPEWGSLVNLFDLQLFPGSPTYNYNDQLEANVRQLSGTIPSSWGGMTSLEWIRLKDHNLTGGFPSEWANNDWDAIYFDNNDFTEFFPFSGAVTYNKLSGLFISENPNMGEGGAVPDVFTNMPNLRSIRLNGNNFSGELPTSFWNLNLIGLNIFDNSFTGTIPDDLSHMTFARNFRVGNNNFSGSLPSILPDSRNLINLDFANCGFTGTIPDAFIEIDNTGTSTNGPRTMFLNGNNLSGTRPDFSQLDDGSGLWDYLTYDDNEFLPADIIPNFTAIDNLFDQRHNYGNQKPFGTAASETANEDASSYRIDNFATIDESVGNSFQWYKDGSQLTAGAKYPTVTDDILDITNITLSDEGTYTLQITNSSLPGAVFVSAEFQLTVIELE